MSAPAAGALNRPRLTLERLFSMVKKRKIPKKASKKVAKKPAKKVAVKKAERAKTAAAKSPVKAVPKKSKSRRGRRRAVFGFCLQFAGSKARRQAAAKQRGREFAAPPHW